MDVHVPERCSLTALRGGCWAGTGSVGRARGCRAPTGMASPKRREATSRIHFIECRSIFTGQRRQPMAKLTPTRVSA